MKIARFIAIILPLMLLGLTARAAEPSAKATIDKVVNALRSHPSVDVKFSVNAGGATTSGSLSMAGKCFWLNTPQMQVWYDGKTQWSYAPSQKEVNVTEPTAAEIAEVNPLAVLSNLDKNYTFRRLKAAAGEERIEIVPRRPTSDFRKALLVVNKSTSMPTRLVVYADGNSTTSLSITSVKPGKKKPGAAYRFDPKKYRGVEVVDLR